MNRQIFLRGATVDLILLQKDNAAMLAGWMNDHETNQFLGRGETPMTIATEEAFIESTYTDENKLVLGIWHCQDQKLIGSTGLHNISALHQTAEFGIVIGNKDYWGNGIGTEVLGCMLTYAFTIRNLRNVTLRVFGNNPRGKRCYEKCGFQSVGSFPNHVFKQGAWHDEEHMIAHNPMYT